MRHGNDVEQSHRNGMFNLSNVHKTKVEWAIPTGLKFVTEVGLGLLLGREATPSGSKWTAVLHGVPVWYTLGVVPGFASVDGLPVLTDEQAVCIAKAWHRSLGHKPWLGECSPTIHDAITAYISIVAGGNPKKHRRLWERAQRISPQLCQTPVFLLTEDQFRPWQIRLLLGPMFEPYLEGLRSDREVEDLVRSSSFLRRVRAGNSVIALLVASLDFAYQNRWVSSAQTWRTLRPFGLRKDGTALLASERSRWWGLLTEYRKPPSPAYLRRLFTGLRPSRERLRVDPAQAIPATREGVVS